MTVSTILVWKEKGSMGIWRIKSALIRALIPLKGLVQMGL
uniref:Uncharacterized protein n=1 Tax=Rhizophora mucronata TaxID=61149 RepID=A0A2P2PQA4_RHIMU